MFYMTVRADNIFLFIHYTCLNLSSSTDDEHYLFTTEHVVLCPANKLHQIC